MTAPTGRRERAGLDASREPAGTATRSVPTPKGRSGGAPIRSNAALARQATPAVARAPEPTHAVQPAPQAKLDVSHVGDPLEREADAVAARVVSGAPVRQAAPPPADVAGGAVGAARAVGAAHAPGAAVSGARSERPVSRRAAPGPPVLARAGDGAGGSAGGTAGGAAGGGAGQAAGQATAEAHPEVTPDLEAYITGVGGGDPLPASVRKRIEPHLGADLTGVRVHSDAAAAQAAARLRARAFTFGADIFLGAGESAGDLELMAHEATHVVQQGAVEVYREDDAGGLEVAASMMSAARSSTMAAARAVARDAAEDDDDWLDIDISRWIAENLASAASSIPGYTTVTQVLGKDPITDQVVQASPQQLVEVLLTWGPFGDAVGPLLQAVDVLGDVFAYVSEQLAAHDLTAERLVRDLQGAWDEFSITEGVSGNLEILERYLKRLLDDITAFVAAIADRVIEMVKEVLADVVEPILERPDVAPIWSLAKKVFHYDPLRGERVDAPTVEILADFLKLIGKEAAVAQMEERGTLQEAAKWIDTQWGTFTSILDQATSLFADAWAAISPANLPRLLDTLPGLVDRGASLFRQILDFGVTLAAKVLELVKDALLGWLSEHAHQLPGFHLITVIIERNPFTDQKVPRTAENLIRGFITLLPGGDEMYAKLSESGVIGDAAARIEGAMGTLGISWDSMLQTFLGVWDLVTLESLLAPLDTFQQILDRFGEPIARIMRFIGVVMEAVITLILSMMDFPADLLAGIIDKVSQSIDVIMADPIGFLTNMLQAVKSGFEHFLSNILGHLGQGLADWLLGGLRDLGVEPPASFEPGAILDFVLSVLGVTAETLWTKLGEQLGEERAQQIRGAIDQLTGAWAFIKDVQERGLAAIWDYISGQLSNLWDTILSLAQDWVMQTVVERVTARLLSMLDPTGVMAVVNSFLVFFDTVRSVIQYMREILEIVDRYVSTIAAVAAGNIGPGADMLEGGLAAAIPVALGFLANIVGLGNLPEKVREIIEGLRVMIDQALTWLFEQAMRLGQAALGALGLGEGPPTEAAPAEPAPAGALPAEVTFDADDGEGGHRLWFEQSGEAVTLMLASKNPGPLLTKIAAWEAKIAAGEPADEAARTQATQLVAQARTLHTGIGEPGTTALAAPDTAENLRRRQVTLGVVLAQILHIFGEQQDLMAAVDSAGGVMNFMRDMVTQRAAGGLTWDQFSALWISGSARGGPQKEKDAVGSFKNAYRALSPNPHEWVPTNFVRDVLEHAISLTDPDKGEFEDGLAWVEFQNNMRSRTYHVVWIVQQPTWIAPESGPARLGGDFGVGGHSGAFVSNRGTIGQEDFHNLLRDFFNEHKTRSLPAFARLLRAYVKQIVWNGNKAGIPQEHWSRLVAHAYRVDGGDDARYESVTIEQLADRQAENYRQIIVDFDAPLAAIGARSG